MNLIFKILEINIIICIIGIFLIRNTVKSIFFLIGVYLNGGILIMLLEVEFLSLIYIIVYVGAISILFLFVIMCLNLRELSFDLSLLGINSYWYIPISCLFGFLLCFEIYTVSSRSYNINSNNIILHNDWSNVIFYKTDLERLGLFLYTDFYLSFYLCGLILLVAMVGSIVLTLSHYKGVKRQYIYNQINRSIYLNIKEKKE